MIWYIPNIYGIIRTNQTGDVPMKYRKNILNPSENILMLRSVNTDAVDSHSHEFIELVYIASGKGMHTIRNKTYFVSAGDIFIITTQDEHSLYPLTGDDSFQWINCIFLPEFLAFDFSIFPYEYRCIGLEGFEMSYIFNSMFKEFADKKPGYLEIMRGYLSVVLQRLARLNSLNNIEEDYKDIKKNLTLKKAIQYIHQNYQEDIRLASIAEFLSISPTYIGKIFKDLKDTSPINYLNRYRIDQSCKLLLETSLPINQIAFESGFRDVKFYYTFFKRITGLPPAKFRYKFKQYC